MKFFRRAKDGGPRSTVTGYWLIEWKRVFSIALLKFGPGSRDEYHSHAFNSWSWILNRGVLLEEFKGGGTKTHWRSWRSIRTLREHFHRVFSVGTTWVLTFRGPWSKTWMEWDPATEKTTTLTDGRREASSIYRRVDVQGRQRAKPFNFGEDRLS